MNLGRKLGWTSPFILSGIPGSILLLALFVYREKRAADPILDLTIFRNRAYSQGMFSGLFGFGLMAGSGVMMPFLLAYLLHIKVEESGFILMTFAVIYSVTSPVAGNLSDHFQKTRLMTGGMMLAFGASLFFTLSMGHMHLWIVFVYLVLLGIAYAFFITPNNNFMVSVADPDKQSLCSSVFKLSTNLGQMTGVVLMELLFVMAMPAGFAADKAHAASLTTAELASGFQYAYAGGAAMCLVALLLTFTLKDRASRPFQNEEPSMMV
jgi:predicted MFS family arabinose efflux permease